MGLKVNKHEAVDVCLNAGLADELIKFLEARKLLTMERMLSDAIPLFVALWNEREQNRLRADIDLFLPIVVKQPTIKFKLFFKKESFAALKEFTKLHAFEDVDQVINSSLEIFIFLVERNEINRVVVLPLQNPEGKLIIELPDYFKK